MNENDVLARQGRKEADSSVTRSTEGSLSELTSHETMLLMSFVEMSGLDPSTAIYYLQAAGWDISVAFTLLPEHGENSTSPQNNQGFTPEQPFPASEPFLRQADPIQRDRLIDIRSSSTLAQERELARKESPSVNWMFPPPRYSNPNPLVEVRKIANQSLKWLLVNLQNHKEFSSHLLNRDVWTYDPLIQFIQSHLIFWQRGSTSPDGQKFLSYYQFTEDQLPIVGIIDPRTGGLVWTMNGPIEGADLLSKIMEFEETNRLDSSAPLVIRKQNEPQRIHEINSLKRTPTQSDGEEEPEYHYDDGDEEGEGDEDDEENLKLALQLSQQLTTPTDPVKILTPSVAPTPSDQELTLFPYGILEDEPPIDSTSITKISFRLPFTPEVSSSTVRRFLLTSTVDQLYCYVHSILPNTQKSKKFDLVTPFPRESLSSKLSQSIGDAGLAGSQVIMKWE